MKINIKEFLEHCGIAEQVYPGKRYVKKLPQMGDFKSHCVVLDWHTAELFHIEIKAGLSGRTLAPADLKKYPVSFQAPTYIDIAPEEGESDEDEEGSGSQGKSGGGGKKPSMRKLNNGMLHAFSNVVEGKIPSVGEVKKLVLMGKEIAKQSYGQVLEKLAEQIKQAKIMATDLLAEAGKFITKVAPPAFMAKRGDEEVAYKYDRMKNEPMFGRPMMG